jgi:hypothetical protein
MSSKSTDNLVLYDCKTKLYRISNPAANWKTILYCSMQPFNKYYPPDWTPDKVLWYVWGKGSCALLDSANDPSCSKMKLCHITHAFATIGISQQVCRQTSTRRSCTQDRQGYTGCTVSKKKERWPAFWWYWIYYLNTHTAPQVWITI